MYFLISRSKKPLKRVDITEIRDSDHKSAMSSNKSTINITQRAEIKESSTQESYFDFYKTQLYKCIKYLV